MGLFNRRKADDLEDGENDRVVKIKDLKGENKKKRGLPPKPWGKKERSLVGLIFISTVVISVVLAFSARHGKVPGLPRVTSPNLGFSETIILENKTPTPVQKKASDRIIESFVSETKSLSGIYALSVVDLKTGISFGVNENEIMQAASLIKLPVMVSAYSEYEAGRFAIDAKYSLRSNDKIGGSGSIIGKADGTIFTYRQLLEYMGQQSDNTAFHVVRNKLTDSVINNYISEMGLKNTSLSENMTTAAEVATIFKKLYEGSLIQRKNSDEMLKFLTKTIYEEYLPKGVPGGILVAHKYGREIHVINDGGIVYSENPYVVVIMTGGVVESEAEKIFPRLSQMVYEGMQN